MLADIESSNEQLRDQLQECSLVTGPVPGLSTAPSNLNPKNEAPNVCYAYVPQEHKCLKFNGKLSLGLLTVDQCVEEVRRCLEIRPLS